MKRSASWRRSLVVGCVLGIGSAALAGTPDRPSSPPDLILFNGTVLTMDHAHPTGQAVAILGDKIAGVGSDAEMRALAGKSTRLVDLQGKTVMPGFIDSRVLGPFGFWEALHGVRLTDDAGTPMSGIDEIAAAFKAYLGAHKAEPGQWLVAAGFDPRLDGTRRFTREWADELAPNQPLLMLSLDHHIALVNSKGIELLGLKSLTYPAGSGQVEKDTKGEPTGVLRELPVFLAMNQVWSQVSADLRRQATASFLDAASRVGITTVGTPLAVPADLETAESLLKEGEFPVRVVAEALGANVGARQAFESYARESKSPNLDRIQVGPSIYALDGSMLSGKAALFQAYQDAPWTSGLLSMTPGSMEDLMNGWASGKGSMVLDASGSLAVHLVIDASERMKASNPGPGEARPLLRVDGLDLIEGDDINRLPLLAKSGWVVSLQPTRFPYQVYLAKAIGDDRMKQALPYRTLVDAGITVAINSNWPMSAQTFQPTQVIKWAVTRSGFRTEEALSIEQALRAYTADAAKALGISDRIGSIEIGKNADLVVLDRNPLEMTATPEALPEVPVRMTIASGTVVFEDRKTASMTPVPKATVAAAGKTATGTPALPGAARD